MFYILYQVTNTVNGKIYVGVHKTKKLDDGYMGSGKVINSAIKKYGVENFTRVILEQFDDSAAMYAREKEVVTDEFLLREDTYNLRRGGVGGFDHINKQGLNHKGFSSAAERNRKISPFSNKENFSAEWHQKFNEKTVSAIKKSRKLGIGHNFTAIESQRGCVAAAAQESIEKRKSTFERIKHQQGSSNSQFGKIWITNDLASKKILKTDLIPAGWHPGRTVKE